MPSNYWIKLYHEILHDPKMCRLTDRLYRRTIELFLLAGETDKEGELPSVGDIAWQLRINQDELETDLADLASFGIVHKEDNWIVSKFATRQAALPDSERMRLYRERKKKQQYNGQALRNVTDIVTDKRYDKLVESDKIRIDKEIEGDKNKTPEASVLINAQEAERLFCETTGMPTFPAQSRDDDIERIIAIHSQQQDKTVDYLKRFFGEWVQNRKYSKGNTAWLDWAVADDIPKKRTNHRGDDWATEERKRLEDEAKKGYTHA
jgi:hypothetical protein